jgi:hypothetical protein
MPLRDFLSNTWEHIQTNLFPWLTEELGPLTDMHKQVITTLELACVEKFVGSWPGLPGRPPLDRVRVGARVCRQSRDGISDDFDADRAA